MNDIQLFTNQLFGSVRTIIDNKGEPWFAGIDVASCLGYANTRDALLKHVLDEDKNTVAIRDGNPGNPNIVFINESGLYSLIFGSKLPSAIEFKHWVTSEVLPTMRKLGFDNSLQLLKKQVLELQQQNQVYINSNVESSTRAAYQGEMRAQIIEKLRSLKSGTVLTPELVEWVLHFDENWEG